MNIRTEPEIGWLNTGLVEDRVRVIDENHKSKVNCKPLKQPSAEIDHEISECANVCRNSSLKLHIKNILFGAKHDEKATKAVENISKDLQHFKSQQKAMGTRLDTTAKQRRMSERLDEQLDEHEQQHVTLTGRLDEHEQQHVTLTGRLDEHDKLFNDCQQLHGDEMQQLRRTIDDLKEEMRRMASEHTVIELQATVRAPPRCVEEGR